MKLTKYILSPEAKQDLVLILEYGLDSYMDHVALGYYSGIKAALGTLVKYPRMGLVYKKYDEEVRKYTYRSHIIFYSIRNGHVYIIRVFNGRQNYKAYFDHY